MLTSETEVVVSIAEGESLRRKMGPGAYVIGSAPEVEICVDDKLVSARHALLTIHRDHAVIEDLGSASGTRVNGQPVSESTRIWAGQKIQLGGASIELRRLKAEASPDVTLLPAEAARRRLLPEELLREHKYEIGAKVAQGGMGAILEAREAVTDRRVAMKVMLSDADSDDLARFVAEAKVTAQLEHPNIVPVHELSVDENGQVFYTMKLVRGITLRKVLEGLAAREEEESKRYPLAVLLTVFQKVCDAVAFAHSKGVLHRDLKPENIMLDDFGVVLVMDWGLAKIIGHTAAPAEDGTRSLVRRLPPEAASATLAGSIMGTPQYMSPEQARGEVETLDARSDIYALGAILYHLLALRPPVAGGSPMEIVGKVAAGRIEALIAPKHRPISEGLSAVVRKAMTFERASRYPRVADLQRDVQAYQNGFATGAEKAGLARQLALLVKRHKGIFTTAVAAWLLITALAVWFVINVTRQKNRAENALAELRRSAPAYYSQAHVLAEEQKLDEALDKIGTAIALQPENADFHLLHANTLEALQRLTEAVQSYRRVLALQPDDKAAQANLELCDRLLRDNGGRLPLAPAGQQQLLDAIMAQGRPADSLPLARALHRDADAALASFQIQLKPLMSHPKWYASRLTRLPDGTFRLDLADLPVPDLGILRGLPISALKTRRCGLVDLAPLSGLPIRELEMDEEGVSDLSPLRGMPLRSLLLLHSRVQELHPLAGMPLETLHIYYGGVTDISPLKDMPLRRLDLINLYELSDFSVLRTMRLEFLQVNGTPFSDLRLLEGMPLHTFKAASTPIRSLDGLQRLPLVALMLSDCKNLTDLSLLADCQQLKYLSIPSDLADPAVLRRIPSLERVDDDLSKYEDDLEKLPTVAEYTARNGERLARLEGISARLAGLKSALRELGMSERRMAHLKLTGGCLDLDLTGLPVSDVSFLAQLPVRTLLIGQSSFVGPKVSVSDLSPLRGAPLQILKVLNAQVSDLGPLRGAPLEELDLLENPVSDLSPLSDCRRLHKLDLTRTSVSDLRPIQGLNLIDLHIDASGVRDVAPLAACSTLTQLLLPRAAKGLEALRHLPHLERISFKYDAGAYQVAQTAAEFWKEFDAKKPEER